VLSIPSNISIGSNVLGAHYPTPTVPSPTLTSLCFQQFGKSAFRSPETPSFLSCGGFDNLKSQLGRFPFEMAHRTPGSVEDRLAKDTPTSKSSLLSDLRFAIHVCHSSQRGRRSRRVGDTVASPGGLPGLQTLLANEERSSGEKLTARPMKCRWILAQRRFSEIYLAQSEAKLLRWSNRSVGKSFIIFTHFMSGRSAAW
jgi:hypothetical protein